MCEANQKKESRMNASPTGGECAGSTPVRDGWKFAVNFDFKLCSEFLRFAP
ncbi:MAG: hypothetical protein IJE60_11845 [Tyzzerella sp.]|nr:hypothetical protein [Tyzzerella sp.]